MGNTINLESCVNLSHAPAAYSQALMAEDLTVIRTDKRLQAGWRIPKNTHTCRYSTHWETSHATREPAGWRVHMVRDAGEDDPEPHVCGWRHHSPGNRTFWPSRLTTQEEKEEWWRELDTQLNTLDNARNVAVVEAEYPAAANRIVPPEASLTELIMAMKKDNPHHANRANRLLDCGLHKSIVREICSMPHSQAERLAEEEAKLGLEPLALPTYSSRVLT